MNDATGGTHAGTEALEAERAPRVNDDDGKTAIVVDADPNGEALRNVDDSVERAGW